MTKGAKLLAPTDTNRAKGASSSPPPEPASVSDGLIAAFATTGTKRLFGVPGGGSSLDLIESARRADMPFVLARHECAAAMMAAATAELDGSIGVAITTKGPGTANATNGVAHAALDRAPLAIVTDGFSPAHRRYVTHQWFDQKALFAPLVKAHSMLDDRPTQATIDALIETALIPVRGAVHLELTGPAARAPTGIGREASASARASSNPVHAAIDANSLDRAANLIAKAQRPVIIVGLECCDADIAALARNWVNALACAALVTYKAKGVIADDSPYFAGVFTGGAAEQAVVREADLIVLLGADPVEFILQPWPYTLPVLEIGWTRHSLHYVEPTLTLLGDLRAHLQGLIDAARTGDWSGDRIASLRTGIRESLAWPELPAAERPNASGRIKGGNDSGALGAQQVVTIALDACAAFSQRPRVTVDAGAHMFSATAFWPCAAPRDLLISNGLASMGFALPAAIASALHEPERVTIAFTGDGGLLMCLGELVTAVEQRAKIVVIVFNDGALSLIDIKQQQRELEPLGVRWNRVGFAATMTALGGLGLEAHDSASYRRALTHAFAQEGPALIDVQVDPRGYPGQLRALRG